jgi:hypothetical protein
MKIYEGLLPGNLGRLTVNLSESGGLQYLYRAPGTEKDRDVGSLEGALAEDEPDQDVVDRLNYVAFMTSVLVSKIKAARKQAEIPDTFEPFTLEPKPTPTIPITADNIHELPEGLSPATRAAIHARLGIKDPQD